MIVRFFAYIRDKDYAGCKETNIVECEDLRELGKTLSQKFGEKFHELYFSPDETAFGKDIIVLVNGRRAEFLDGLDTKLKDSDLILLFPVVAGG
ncbi:MAG: MoaD family protein [Parasporobacterium sp.]|nr:MoaD family protein [Parasporobacterium sp.]